MRLGSSWRVSVFVSMLLLLSGQFCMLTTCLPRMARAQGAAHACCHTERTTPARTPAPTGAMPCGQSIVLTDAVVHEAPAPTVQTIAWDVVTPSLAAPVARPLAREGDDTGPPLARTSPASAGLRAPPQG